MDWEKFDKIMDEIDLVLKNNKGEYDYMVNSEGIRSTQIYAVIQYLIEKGVL